MRSIEPIAHSTNTCPDVRVCRHVVLGGTVTTSGTASLQLVHRPKTGMEGRLLLSCTEQPCLKRGIQASDVEFGFAAPVVCNVEKTVLYDHVLSPRYWVVEVSAFDYLLQACELAMHSRLKCFYVWHSRGVAIPEPGLYHQDSLFD
jgi:hypothetical protein